MLGSFLPLSLMRYCFANRMNYAPFLKPQHFSETSRIGIVCSLHLRTIMAQISLPFQQVRRLNLKEGLVKLTIHAMA